MEISRGMAELLCSTSSQHCLSHSALMIELGERGKTLKTWNLSDEDYSNEFPDQELLNLQLNTNLEWKRIVTGV